MNTQPEGRQAASPQSTEPTKVTITQRVRRPWRSGEQRSNRPGADSGSERRLETRDAGPEHLELVLEGLQDAVHRGPVREDESIGELHRRTVPVASDLNRNARVVMAGSERIEHLRAEARYHRERYDLYKAKMYAQRPTTMGRLRELELAHQGAEARLRRAEQERASHNRD